MLSVMLRVIIMLNVIMLSVVMLKVIMLSVVKLSVVAPRTKLHLGVLQRSSQISYSVQQTH
jgi:hypothetical protein